MLTILEKRHFKAIIKVLRSAEYSYNQAVAIATGYLLKLRKLGDIGE